MNKFVASLVLSLLSCASVAQEQVAALETGAKLPEFKAVFKFSNTGNVGDVSLSDASGLSGLLSIGGNRCFFKDKVQAKEIDGRYVIKIDRLSAFTPGDTFCEIDLTISIDQKAGMFGSKTGRMEWVYRSLENRVANATFSFTAKAN